MMRKHLVFSLLCVSAVLILSGCAVTRPPGEVRSEVAALVVPFTGPGSPADRLAPPGELTDDERALLLSVLVSPQSIEEVKFLGVLSALVADGHPDTVARLCELLHEQENRYYALALGAIGDRAALPALRRRCRTTTHDYVYNDCRLALQLLGDRSSLERLPDPTRPVHSPLRISATTDRGSVGEGEPFEVAVTIRNGGEEPLAFFYPIYSISRCVSVDGDHLIAMQGAHIFYDVTEQNYRVLGPGEQTQIIERYAFVRRPIGIERNFLKWLALPGEVLCLMQTNGAHQGRRVAVAEPGRRITLRLAYAYDGSAWIRDHAEKLGIEHAVFDRVVSQPVEVTCVVDGG